MTANFPECDYLLDSSPIAAFIAVKIFSLTRRLRNSSIFAVERSNSTGDCSIRRIIVPSEKPASTSSQIESFVKLFVFSSFVGAPPASVGGRRIRTVAEPVVTVSPDDEPLPLRVLVEPLLPPLEPKISALLPSFEFPAFAGSLATLWDELKNSSSPHASSENSLPS